MLITDNEDKNNTIENNNIIKDITGLESFRNGEVDNNIIDKFNSLFSEYAKYPKDKKDKIYNRYFINVISYIGKKHKLYTKRSQLRNGEKKIIQECKKLYETNITATQIKSLYSSEKCYKLPKMTIEIFDSIVSIIDSDTLLKENLINSINNDRSSNSEAILYKIIFLYDFYYELGKYIDNSKIIIKIKNKICRDLALSLQDYKIICKK